MAVRERYDEGRTRLMPVGLVETDDGTLVYPVDKGSGATTSLVEADGVVQVDADTAYLAEDEAVTVQLFSPDVRAPTLLGVGEDDPALSRLLDRLERPRYLDVGSRQARRRLRDGVPDAAVVSGPSDRDVDAVDLGGWTREWGLVVAPDADVSGLADLIDGDYRFINRSGDAGLRASLDAELDSLADDRGVDRRDLTDAVDGYDLTVKGFESPARKVRSGAADAGLGLRATAAALDCDFVSLGTESVRILVNPDRTDKAGVAELDAALDTGLDDAVAELPGFDPDPRA